MPRDLASLTNTELAALLAEAKQEAEENAFAVEQEFACGPQETAAHYAAMHAHSAVMDEAIRRLLDRQE